MQSDMSETQRQQPTHTSPAFRTSQKITRNNQEGNRGHPLDFLCQAGGNYQSLINNVLREYVEKDQDDLELRLRNIIREELKKASRLKKPFTCSRHFTVIHSQFNRKTSSRIAPASSQTPANQLSQGIPYKGHVGVKS